MKPETFRNSRLKLLLAFTNQSILNRHINNVARTREHGCCPVQQHFVAVLPRKEKMVRIKKLMGAVALVLALTVGATGCGSRGGGAEASSAAKPADSLVGISMPTQTSERWIADGANVEKSLKDLGYKTDLQFANDDIPTQVSQIENMLTKGAKALNFAAIDGTTLTDVLAKAKEQNVKVIAYDRLINGTPNVDFYTTFDNYEVGVPQATSLLTGLGLMDASGKKVDGKGTFNVELFAGSPDDNN